jgi:hypothetical protein
MSSYIEEMIQDILNELRARAAAFTAKLNVAKLNGGSFNNLEAGFIALMGGVTSLESAGKEREHAVADLVRTRELKQLLEDMFARLERLKARAQSHGQTGSRSMSFLERLMAQSAKVCPSRLSRKQDANLSCSLRATRANPLPVLAPPRRQSQQTSRSRRLFMLKL